MERGDTVTVVHRPSHEVTVEMTFRALTLQPELLPRLLDAPELDEEVLDMARRGQTFDLG